MAILKKILLTLLTPLFTFLLFATALDIGFVRIATHPQTVKDLVSKSGIYDSIVPNLLQQNDSISTPLGDISTADPQIKAAVTAAISPKTVQRQSDAAIDSIYAWLDGKTTVPDFSFGLSNQKDQFAASIASVVEQRLQTLPACSRAQSLAIATTASFNALDATCLPSGVAPAASAQTVKDAVLNGDYLSKASISSADIKDSTGQPVFQTKLKDAPKKYQFFKKTPFMLVILTVLAGAAVVTLSRTWQKGLRHVGITIFLTGMFVLILAWGLNKAVNDSLPKLNIDNAVLEQSVNGLVKEVAHQITGNYRLFGWIYTGLGSVSAAAGFYLIRRDAQSVKSAPEPQEASGDPRSKRP